MISYKRVGGLELQCDGGEALRESIVNLACQAVTFLDGSQARSGLGMFCGEASTLDGKTNLGTDDVQQLQFLRFEFAPVFAGNVQYTDACVSRVNRHTREETQPQRGWTFLAFGIFQAAAPQHLAVAPPFMVAFQKDVLA